ncbi:MAG TPA: GAF domain-containing SpoIIE family protein phosphatase [Gaiellaceae bacterium]|nr:GAF domain-containing SpoIIE family protein phosphatase [Gaiellaceae bacterium]
MSGSTETESDRRDAEIDGLAAELLARYEEITLLYRLSSELSGTLDLRELCRRALGSARQVLSCSDAEIGLLGEDGLTIAASAGEMAWRPGTVVPAGSGITGAVASSGRPIVLDPDDETPDGLTTARRPGEAIVSVPLRLEPPGDGDGEEPIGALTLMRRAGDARFTAGDVQLAQAIALQLAARVEASRFAHGMREAERAERELELAATVQRSLLPDVPPELGGLRLAARNRSAAMIGGDLYDVVLDEQGRLWALVADVTGHGVGSALAMAMVRTVLRLQLQEGESPGHALRAANDALYDDLVRSELLVTAFCARYDAATGRLAYASAAQNPPLLRRAGGGVEHIDADGTPLGLLPGVDYEEVELTLERGDLLLLYTDGAEEARDADGNLLGIEPLRELVAAASDPATLVETVLAVVAAHAGGAPRADDVTLLAVTPA